jgi:3-dehydroquinate synthase
MLEVGLERGACILVTDANVAGLALDPAVSALERSGWQPHVTTIEAGEGSKSGSALEKLYDFALKARIDRSTPLIALGGGVVGDLAGFAAATLLRGIPLVHVPTTLVSQVDSSIGGKTGINHLRGKNLIGAFYQPDLILCDTDQLQTLPDREWLSGMGEVVKHALIDSPAHTSSLLDAWDRIMVRDPSALDEAIPRSAAVKVRVVTQDEREADLRSILNFGHTGGHAIERSAGYGVVSHGQAVAAGMALALKISDAVYPAHDRREAWRLLSRLGWPELGDFNLADVLDAITYDKKWQTGRLRFVLLSETGRPEIRTDVTVQLIRSAWESLVETAGGNGGT